MTAESKFPNSKKTAESNRSNLNQILTKKDKPAKFKIRKITHLRGQHIHSRIGVFTSVMVDRKFKQK